MKIRLRDGLPYVVVSITHHDQQLTFENVLLDTGSAGTIFPTDKVLAIGLQYEADDLVHRIRGVGGAEFVFAKRVDRLSLGKLQVNDFEVEIGTMDYGLKIDGIVGVNFLTQVSAVIDLAKLEIYQVSTSNRGERP
jgi:predicted aspartyl protease